MNNDLMFESAGDERGTPQDFFDQLNAEFHFDVDCAASALNHKCELWFGEGGIAFDALETDWGGEGTTCFLNPPYSVAGAFVKKAREEADKGAVVVLLLPARTDTKWWHSYVWDHTSRTSTPDYLKGNPDGDVRPGVRLRLIPGRLNFELHVPGNMRAWIKSELVGVAREHKESSPKTRAEALVEKVRELTKVSGLPKMAIERIAEDQPDDCLLDSAPFPSCVVIFSKA